MVDPASFDVSDVILSGPDPGVKVDGVSEVADSGGLEVDVLLSDLTEFGEYAMTLGPQILDLDGNPMDQDGDGVNGELPDDQFT